ncbi:class I SAM-dependent methyltransferase [Candidatus Gracilibacteria bacterium]|nr:class I SAM-dependent methyltransferase [Candidatus Gracilibacteria bacterium]NUJ99020.1 class I SAM-dependent methyltransferase [Candidatus Gracilibacteria bacterium]
MKEIIKNLLGKKLTNTLFNIFYGDRIIPGILNISRIHFISLKKYITYFVDKFVMKNNTILDFGCGNMIYKDFFYKKNCQYYGLDIGESPENNGNYIIYEGGKIPFEDKKFDIVISTQVFEHLKDVKFYAQEIERITKKGGYILLTIAHVWEYHPYPKHYQNIMFDIIPEIFTNSKIIEYKGDTTEYQNLNLFKMKYLSKHGLFGLFLIGIVNLKFIILDKLNLSKIGPTKYNPFTGNILIILKVK